MNTLLIINMKPQTFGYLFIIIGILILFIIGMRRFNRRGLGGMQHYSNYFIAVISSILEWVLSKVAFILIVIGLFMAIQWQLL
ncbi:hypothetical protein [Pedobacter sp. WC2423]|uniref:hypothetical protein n=1 Tax=Pedobacter sp. WC2423 TaxID=3234142 RepID=UPI00346719B8